MKNFCTPKSKIFAQSWVVIMKKSKCKVFLHLKINKFLGKSWLISWIFMDFGQKLNSPGFRVYKVGFRVFSGITFSGSVRVRVDKKASVRFGFSGFRVPDTSLAWLCDNLEGFNFRDFLYIDIFNDLVVKFINYGIIINDKKMIWNGNWSKTCIFKKKNTRLLK